MINPDGVVLGNYRLSYSGCDLNRKWKETSRRLHKEVYELKRHIIRWEREGGIRMVLDVHGHSRKKGVFFYGCKSIHTRDCDVKEFPYLMSTIHPSFSYKNSNFTMPKSK